MICEHVYKNVGASICPKCGRDTHEIDWEVEQSLFREYYREGKHLYSLCPVEGGTIRGWWSI